MGYRAAELQEYQDEQGAEYWEEIARYEANPVNEEICCLADLLEQYQGQDELTEWDAQQVVEIKARLAELVGQ